MDRYQEAAARGWDGLAETWAEMQGDAGDGNQQFTINPALFALAGEVAGKRVLDAACGGGHIARALARRGAHVTTVDISPRMIALARRRAEREGLAIAHLVGSITSLPQLTDASFDHGRAKYPLTGKHSTLACAKCHRSAD